MGLAITLTVVIGLCVFIALFVFLNHARRLRTENPKLLSLIIAAPIIVIGALSLITYLEGR